MRTRPSSRLLVVDAAGCVLLFRFAHKQGALAGQAFWATPGGGLDPGESYAEAARRELFEETGIAVDDPGPEISRRLVTFRMPDGDMVEADERFFLIRRDAPALSRAGWTPLEQEVMAAHRWWSPADLRATPDQVWPEDLAGILIRAGVWPALP